MSRYRINPYTGLPAKKTTNFKVIPADGQSGKYVIVDGNGDRRSKFLSKPQLDIATRHTINAVSASPTGKIDDLGQALVNFQYDSDQAKQ